MEFPRHQRAPRDFAKTFERNYKQTIASMDRGGHDIPNQAPTTPLRLKSVGVKRHAIPILLRDPFGVGSTVQLSCAVTAHVGLEPQRRGIHVSRIGDLLARLSVQIFSSLQDYAVQLNELIRSSQKSPTASVSVQGTLTYLEIVSGVKEKSSLEHLKLSADARFIDNVLTTSGGVGFSHMTACPCVQETYRNSFEADNPSFEAVRAQKHIPLITHTQRCQTLLTLTSLQQEPTLPELLSCIDSVVVRSQNTLPREFELLNVYRAHAHPQFLEDVLRDLLLAVYRLLPRGSPDGSIMVRSSSLESIHDFDMEGEIEFAIRELDRIFAWHREPGAALAPPLRVILPLPNGSNLVRNGGVAKVQKAGRKKPGSPSLTKRSPQADSKRS
jgi:GTP cyclohydrolase FolE2